VKVIEMRNLSLLFIAPMFSLSTWGLWQATTPQIESVTAWTIEQASIDQLEKMVTMAHGKRDKEVAQQISPFHLTQRLRPARFEKLSSELPGKESRQALLAMSDESAFLDLPSADLLSLPEPSRLIQGQIVRRASDSVAGTLSKMPDFIATRTTTRFRDVKETFLPEEPTVMANQRFRVIDRKVATAVYRDGKEIDQSPKESKPRKEVSAKPGLESWGEFGPLLGVVVANLLNGKIAWSHWEPTADGPAAVFRFIVSEDKSNYTIRYCCDRADGSPKRFTLTPAYHGEIALNPATGAVLRIVLITDLKPDLSLKRADIVVDYGPVDIGGHTYICPVKSVSISMDNEPATVIKGISNGMNWLGPRIIAINDVVFDHYHQFRGEMRIVPDSPAQR
jgi:hypothetical protein